MSAQPIVGEPEVAGEQRDESVEKAERLARIVVSDIILYNQEKFETALRNGNVLEAMQADLAEGRSLFDSRIDPSTREKRDFLTDELIRVAKGRAGG